MLYQFSLFMWCANQQSLALHGHHVYMRQELGYSSPLPGFLSSDFESSKEEGLDDYLFLAEDEGMLWIFVEDQLV